MPLDIDYHDINVHKLMLGDGTRCESFRRALAETVKPGDAVLDVGAGTGLLGIFAARAGARAVYAVERTRTADLARRIISANGLADRIHVIRGDMQDIDLPEQVDVIVSEWLGGYAIDENLLPVIAQARDRWLRPGGVLIPGVVSSWIAPVYDELLEQDVRFWRERPYGIDLAAIGDATSRLLRCCQNHVKEKHLLADPQQMWEIDPASISLEQSTDAFEANLSFTCWRSGRCNALATWFEARLSENVTLSNKPSDLYTHWGRWIFPVGMGFEVADGSAVAVYFRAIPEGPGRSRAIWQVSARDYSFSSEDVTRLTR